MGIPGISLGISGREDSVDKHKGANNLCSKAITLGISMADGIGSTTKPLVLVFLEALHHSSTTDGSQALHYHVKHSPGQRELPCQQQPKSHCWVNMTSCTTPVPHKQLDLTKQRLYFKLIIWSLYGFVFVLHVT